VSLRQAVTPDRLQGRVQASVKSFTWGLSPVGYLLGGSAGQLLDLRLVLVLAGIGLTLSTGWLIASPVPGVRSTGDVHSDD
ncbi:MAG TPA: MFS transporter, partial [Candidatus Dormibacteraeota bacterium]|nr:MFS transporter [Candidatus Dormibacteraeota bacterium]